MHPGAQGLFHFFYPHASIFANCQIVLSLLLHICVGEKVCNAEAGLKHRRTDAKLFSLRVFHYALSFWLGALFVNGLTMFTLTGCYYKCDICWIYVTPKD